MIWRALRAVGYRVPLKGSDPFNSTPLFKGPRLPAPELQSNDMQMA